MEDRVINRSSKRITQHYKVGVHKGVDLGYNGTNEEQNKVYANCEGVVYETRDGYGRNIKSKGVATWGNYVYVKHPNGMFTRYAHLQKGLFVKKGQKVDENTCLGIIGISGKAYARHLHYEVSTGYSSAKRINPEPYLTKPVYEKPTKKGEYYWVYDNKKNKWLPKVKIGSNDYAGNIGNSISGLVIENHRYRVHDKKKGYWLSWINGTEDYAGNLSNDIDAIQIENATYKVYDNKKKKWLPIVVGTKDYAGNIGNSIGAIQIID